MYLKSTGNHTEWLFHFYYTIAIFVSLLLPLLCDILFWIEIEKKLSLWLTFNFLDFSDPRGMMLHTKFPV